MSRENVEIVRDALARLNRSESILDVLSPDIVWEVNAGPEQGEFQGIEAVAAYYRRYLGAWVDFRVEVEETRDAGDKVFLATRDRGRGKGSGVDVEMPVFQVWTLNDGEVVRGAVFPTRAQALEAAGLSE